MNVTALPQASARGSCAKVLWYACCSLQPHDAPDSLYHQSGVVTDRLPDVTLLAGRLELLKLMAKVPHETLFNRSAFGTKNPCLVPTLICTSDAVFAVGISPRPIITGKRPSHYTGQPLLRAHARTMPPVIGAYREMSIPSNDWLRSSGRLKMPDLLPAGRPVSFPKSTSLFFSSFPADN